MLSLSWQRQCPHSFTKSVWHSISRLISNIHLTWGSGSPQPNSDYCLLASLISLISWNSRMDWQTHMRKGKFHRFISSCFHRIEMKKGSSLFVHTCELHLHLVLTWGYSIQKLHLPSLSPRALPARNLDTNGVLDKDRHVAMKTLCVALICSKCPHSKPNAIIRSVM